MKESKSFQQIMEEVKQDNMMALERKAIIANQTAKIARNKASRELSYRVKRKMIYHALVFEHAHLNGQCKEQKNNALHGVTFATGKRLHLPLKKELPRS